jgi:DNA-binding transcriptional LysR family regulator
MHSMNWDDLRFVAAVARDASLTTASRKLGVDHTTVGRRIATLEAELGLELFVRSPRGYRLSAEGERLLTALGRVEDAVLAVEREAGAASHGEGVVRVTSPETFGVAWLAPRLARIPAVQHGTRIELLPSGQVLDLVRREADVAIRSFRTKHQSLVSRRLARIGFGLYASREYLRRRPVHGAAELGRHALLFPSDGIELAWVRKLVPGASPAFTSELSLGLREAAQADVGIAVLPRYLGDAAGLLHLPMPDEPEETLWLTVHRDVKDAPRVRRVLEFLVAESAVDRSLRP